MQTITKQYGQLDIQHERAIRMAQVVQKFASTLCQREVRTRLVDEGIAPAWSTSNTITFAEADLADLGTAEGVLSSKGLSLHEVSHILFTPRSGSDIVRWVIEHHKSHAFNALEDQRIETLMVGRFGEPVVPWLTAVVAQHLLSNPATIRNAFPLIRGRKYLPAELRRAVRDSYTDQSAVQELSDIIDEYRVLLFPQDTDRAKELITRYAELVKGNEPEGGCTNKSADSYDTNGESRPVGKRAQENARDKAQKRDEQDETELDEFDFGNPSNEPDEVDEQDETDGSSDGDEFDEDEEDEFDEDEEDGSCSEDSLDGDQQDGEGEQSAPTDSTNEQEGNEPDSSGKSAGKGEAPQSDKLSDLLNDIIDEQADRLSDELRRDIASYNGEAELVGGNARVPKTAQTISGTVDEATVRASKAFGTELERLRADFDPAWERQLNSGKINVSRYLRGCDVDEAFDKWSTGREDAVDIEAVIVLDASGSMQGDDITKAGNAMWGLKRALDRVGAGCTVVAFRGYEGAEELVYKSDEPASSTVKRIEANGGTDPLGALKYAKRVLAESDRSVKILFTITDGEWGASDASDELIRQLRRAGVLTAMSYIYSGQQDVERIPAHECEVVSHIANTSDLFFLGRQLVKLATSRNLAR